MYNVYYQTFLEHINKVHPAFKFTVEGNQENGAIPFLDTLVKPEAENTLSITVYRKPMYTDQYLQRDSHHNLAAKYSMISSLAHRAKTSRENPVKTTITTPVVTPQGGTPTRTNTVRDI